MPAKAAWIVSALALFIAAAAGAGERQSDLIGYGRISMTEEKSAAGEGAAVFTCESPERADQLLSKLRADFTWDRLLGIREVKLSGGAPAFALDGCGVLVLAVKGNAVYAVAAATPEAMEVVMKQLGFVGEGVRFLPEKPHPMSLDFYDLRPISTYYLIMNARDLAKGLKRYDREVLARASDFWAPFKFGHSFFDPYFGMDELADGAPHFFPLEQAVARAKAHDAVVMARPARPVCLIG